MSQQKIADTMHKDKNSITKLVDAMEKKNLMERCRDKEDRRSNIVVLTKQAEELKHRAKEAGISMMDKVIDGISEEELKQFLGTLEKMSRNMSDI